MRKSDPDLIPLPRWKQRRAAVVAWWRRTRDQRRRTLKHLRITGRKALTLAISMLGATLISYGVYQVYPPAGLVVAGLLAWGLQWNYGKEEGDGS